MFESGNQAASQDPSTWSENREAARSRQRRVAAKAREEQAQAESAAQARRRDQEVAKFGLDRLAERDRANAFYILSHSVRHFLDDCPHVAVGECGLANEFGLPPVNENNVEQSIASLAWVDRDYIKDPDLPTYWDCSNLVSPGFVTQYFSDRLARYRGEAVESDRDWYSASSNVCTDDCRRDHKDSDRQHHRWKH